MKSHKLLLHAADIAQMPAQEKVHFLNPNAIRLNRSLGDAVGLKNIGVHLITVAPGHDSTAYHTTIMKKNACMPSPVQAA